MNYYEARRRAAIGEQPGVTLEAFARWYLDLFFVHRNLTASVVVIETRRNGPWWQDLAESVEAEIPEIEPPA